MAKNRTPQQGGKPAPGGKSRPGGVPPGRAPFSGPDKPPSSRPDQSKPATGRHKYRRAPSSAEGPNRDTSVKDGRILLFGFHPVREALRAGRRTFFRLFATPNANERLAGDIAALGLEAEIVTTEDLSRRLPPDAVHQGILAEVSELPTPTLDDLPPDGLVLVLDQVTDPHNVGAIVRTAAAFAVDAIVTTERHSPALTGVLAKSASGGLEHVPVITVVNLARAMEKLQDAGYLRAGLDSDGTLSLEAMDLHRPLALVLGAEGKGLRRLTRENCDMVARLDMPGKIRSLNVSNACAVALAIAHLKLNCAK